MSRFRGKHDPVASESFNLCFILFAHIALPFFCFEITYAYNIDVLDLITFLIQPAFEIHCRILQLTLSFTNQSMLTFGKSFNYVVC